jgi:hypothetical protein
MSGTPRHSELGTRVSVYNPGIGVGSLCMARTTRRSGGERVVPHSRGGSSNIENVVIACCECNVERDDRELAYVAS